MRALLVPLRDVARYLPVAGVAALALFLMGYAVRAQRQRVHQSTCLQNLHQLHQDLARFRLDNGGAWPDLMQWQALTQERVRCPAAATSPDSDRRYTGYAINSLLSSSGAATEPLPYPALTVVVSEQSLGIETAASCQKDQRPGYEALETPCARHQGKGNFLFADGQVRTLAPDALEGSQTEFDRASGGRFSFLAR